MDRARDELFSHIQRCGVLEAETDQRTEWMVDTIEYISERYPSLSKEDLGQLKEIGIRYCAPAIPHGDGDAPTGAVAETREPEAEEASETQDVEPVTEIEDVEDVEPAAELGEDAEEGEDEDEDESAAAELEEEERDEVGVA